MRASLLKSPRSWRNSTVMICSSNLFVKVVSPLFVQIKDQNAKEMGGENENNAKSSKTRG